jgi:hypothetical protein
VRIGIRLGHRCGFLLPAAFNIEVNAQHLSPTWPRSRYVRRVSHHPCSCCCLRHRHMQRRARPRPAYQTTWRRLFSNTSTQRVTFPSAAPSAETGAELLILTELSGRDCCSMLYQELMGRPLPFIDLLPLVVTLMPLFCSPFCTHMATDPAIRQTGERSAHGDSASDVRPCDACT